MRTAVGFAAAVWCGSVVNGQTTTTSTPLPCEDQNIDDTMSCNEALANSGITTCLEAEEYMPNCAHCICADGYVPPDIDYACAASCNTIYLQDDANFCRDSSGGACCSAGAGDPFFFTHPDTQSRSCFCSFDASGSTAACATNEKRTMSYFLCNNATITFLNEAIEGPCTVIMDEGCCNDRSHLSAFDDPYSGEQACWCNGYNSPTCEGVWTDWSECKQGHQSRSWTYTQTKGTNGCELTHDDFDFRQCTIETTTTTQTQTTTTVACSQENPLNGDYFYCVALGTCLRHSDYSRCPTTTLSTTSSVATTTTVPVGSASTEPMTSQPVPPTPLTAVLTSLVASTRLPNIDITSLGPSNSSSVMVSTSTMPTSNSSTDVQPTNPTPTPLSSTVNTRDSTGLSTVEHPSTPGPPTTKPSPPATGGSIPTLANQPSTDGSGTLVDTFATSGGISSKVTDLTARRTTTTTALILPSVEHSEPTEQPPTTDQRPTTGSTTDPDFTNTDVQFEENTPMIAGIVVAVVIVAIVVVVVVVVQKNKQRDRHVVVRQSSYVPPASAASAGGHRGGAIPRYRQSNSVATAFASSEDDGGDSVFGVDSSDSEDADFDDVAVGIGGDTTGNFSDSEFSA
eukprot:INCI18344.1.p1 GENE.INCI18344.1~~INCI18344.1.p1  ORF type:complete len:625 (+),score=93.94 INCI18344.1:126-2000(+)